MSKSTITSWDIILEHIDDKKCILLLGPEICVTDKGQPFEGVLIQNLKAEIKKKKVVYYENEELFFFPDNRTKTICLSKIKNLCGHLLVLKRMMNYSPTGMSFPLVVLRGWRESFCDSS